MAWAGFNQRQFPRVATECDISLSKAGEKSQIRAKTQNLGAGGVCVLVPEEMERFSNVRLSIRFDKREEDLVCGGRVVWVVKSKDPQSGKVTFDTGIEFLDISEEEENGIRAFLERKQN